MAEHREEPEAATEQALDQASPAAVSLALGRTGRAGKAFDTKAATFLDEQTKLIRLQTEHLHEQRELQTSRLRLGRWKDRLSLALQALTGLVGLAVAGAIVAMAWQAHNDHGLTIAAFSVPPDLAQKGLTGQVVATRVLDRLSELQTETVSARPASTYAENWGDDIKVEIPETGVSLGDINRWLRQWLGHETRIIGDVVRTASGLSVTARAGSEPGKTVQGGEADIDAMVSQSAEALYASTQPYRYAVYLSGHGKPDEALAIYTSLTRSESTEDRRWAYTGWSALLMQRGDNKGAVAVLREGQRQGLSLHDTGGDHNLTAAENFLQRRQALLSDARASLERDKSSKLGTIYVGPQARRAQGAAIAGLLGDLQSAAAGIGAQGDLTFEGGGSVSALMAVASYYQIADHDVSGGRRALDAITGPPESARHDNDMAAAKALDDWAGSSRSPSRHRHRTRLRVLSRRTIWSALSGQTSRSATPGSDARPRPRRWSPGRRSTVIPAWKRAPWSPPPSGTGRARTAGSPPRTARRRRFRSGTPSGGRLFWPRAISTAPSPS